jgi:hypothetical protein
MTIKYYEEMAQQFGGLDRAQQFSRFYPIPSVGHCLGNVGGLLHRPAERRYVLMRCQRAIPTREEEAGSAGLYATAATLPGCRQCRFEEEMERVGPPCDQLL